MFKKKKTRNFLPQFQEYQPKMKNSFNTKNIFPFLLILILVMAFACKKSEEAIRVRADFNAQWKFQLEDSENFKEAGYNDDNWRILNLPHDWSIEGKFSKDHPAGIGGGALPGGIGWYRKSFVLPEADAQKRIYITFDGVYHNSEVFINGHFLGKRPNGYIGFQYDMTDYLNFGDKPNMLAVRVDNSDQPNSRWYSGSGIYRNVWLEKTNPIHICLWGTHVTTSDVSAQSASVSLSVVLKNTTSQDQELMIETTILDESRKAVAKTKDRLKVAAGDTASVFQSAKVPNPKLWSIETPHLYKAVSKIYLNNKVVDSYETLFGIRYFEFDSKKGFTLNGVPTKILGVCNHHDLGALGAAVNTRAIERQLEILKQMGANAIRTAHNPPAPELLQLCDRMGFLVMNETFDMWAKKKVDYDYSNIWDEWRVRDLTDHLLRDRNHPSVIMWSIGNEILEQWDTTGIQIARELTAIVKKYAPQMQVSSGLNFPEPHNYIYKSGVLDLVGYNYHHETFEQFAEKFPNEKFIATETTSSLNSRGVYDMPADSLRVWPVRWDIPFYDGNPDNTCSSYDNVRTPWGSTHRDSWKLIKQHDYLSGLFIWTGFDYLGEPTPYQWPSRSSYFGIIDLAGFPKDAYYMYQSEWTKKPVLYLFPHWNWKEGQMVDVWAYTNFEKVELFLNDVSLGVRTKGANDLHLAWKVKFEPGVIKAVGTNADGSSLIAERKTAGEAKRIILEADRASIKADNYDLSFITVKVVDQDGVMLPFADNLIEFETDDLLTIAAVDNGSQTSHEAFKANYRKAFNGQCLLIVQSKNQKGISKVRAKSQGLEGASIDIKLN